MNIKEILGKIDKRFFNQPTVVTLRPKGTPKGRVLFSYLIEPFFLTENAGRWRSHTNLWESREMARVVLEGGYEVDVIHYQNDAFVPKKKYDYFIFHYNPGAALPDCLPKACRKFLHITGSYWEFRNNGAAKRLRDLEQRKKVTLFANRNKIAPNTALKIVEAATMMGNDFTIGTYESCGLKMHRIYSSPSVDENFSCQRNHDEARRNFIWLGSGGFVLKGLDLVLEAFSHMPHLHLDVFGPVEGDMDFIEVYRRELYETSNITMHGWVDVGGERFKKIVECAVAIVYASCSEGSSTGVINCMHMGLIPIASYQSGVDMGDVGIVLKECSIDEIKGAVEKVSQMSAHELEERSKAAAALARSRYTRSAFRKSYKKFVDSVMGW